MPYCTNCGTLLPESVAFCQKCGQHQATVPVPDGTVTAGLSPNAAALLSYTLGWLTGLIFFIADKRPYVRFHAAQSMVTFGALHTLRIVCAMIFGVSWWFGGMRRMGDWSPAWPIMGLIGFVSFVLWFVLMVKAYQGQKFKVPLAGDIAENLARG